MSTAKERDDNTSVAVVGAGFAGTRAALDLAETGVKVYLIEKKNTPGGTLTDLERMFPDNECGACTALPGNLSTGCQRQYSNVTEHPNIEFIGGTVFQSLKGDAGKFTLTLGSLPKYVAVDTCTGCGECNQICPVCEPQRWEGAILREFPQACLPVTIEKGKEYPCREACAIGLNVPGFVQLVKAGHFLEAWKLMYAVNPFPSLCGYRCRQSCNDVCSGTGGEPLDIAALARFVAEYVYNNYYPELPLPEIKKQHREKIAIIGSGPAGLTSAYHLVRQGYSVSVLESSSQAGGLLRSKASPHLAKLLDIEISLLRQLGVEIATGVTLGASLPVENLLYCGYQAVLIATTSRITSISRIWQRVSSGGQMPSSYQVTISEKEKSSVMNLVEKPSIYNFDLPGIFAIRSLAFGSVHGDLALMAGQMASDCIGAYLSTKKEVRDYIPSTKWNQPKKSKSPGRFTQQPYVRENNQTERPLTPEEAVLEAGRCLNCGGGCVECGLCVDACPTGSIDLNAVRQTMELETGSVIFATGLDVFDASALDYYGYGVFPNVITSKDFERLFTESNLAGQNFTRPSGDASPLRVAWIQCVGSRNKKHLEYCSSLCCQFAFKEAVMLKEAYPEIETVIFGMDIRPYSINGEEYMQSALTQGLRFERTRIFNLEETEGNNIRIRYAREDGSLQEEDFGLVVLSTGLKPNSLGSDTTSFDMFETDEYGFARTSDVKPCETTCQGVFSAGILNGPKDIAASVIEARAAAMAALEALNTYTLTPVRSVKTFDPLEEPRVGVFVCGCGGSIEKAVSTSSLSRKAKNLPFVTFSESIDFACLPDGLEQIKKAVKKYELNRVVLGGCTPRLRAKEITGALEEAGIMSSQTERVNLREQVAWVHSNNRAAAEIKAFDLLRAGVRKAVIAENYPESFGIVNGSLLVVGGTVGGLNAALAAAGRGIRVNLISKENSLEISLNASSSCSSGTYPRDYVASLIKMIHEHPLIEVRLSARVISVNKSPGHMQTEIISDSGRQKIIHGAVILAGGTQWRCQGELWNNNNIVKTTAEFREILSKGYLGDLRTVLFLPPAQLKGFSNYSKSGCIAMLQSALRAKYSLPDVNVYFLYRDMLVYGKDETIYNEARQSGVIFIRFEPQRPPIIDKAEEGLQVEVFDNILGDPILIKPDLIVMEKAGTAEFENLSLAGLFGAQLKKDGYFREASEKFRPLDSNAAGVYLCGQARGPVSMEEEILQGKAAAMGALTYLIKENPDINRHVARVTEKWCNGCGLCLSACPSGARSIDPETRMAVVNQSMCLGCGACQAACRSAATHQVNLSKKQVLEVIDELLN